ncbi:hypothetical protein BS78_06G100900 [Paspalum vaginatum]|uniref:Secreted protein n=1 Tax=Paspalum vaginatum TaxID=158149 RepID=A0A9W7XA80_9POAL|nr:hypothetical protein BS78_K308400 [Paspalum vaginatum]KAJ1271072.1 hypothetical protein BS78_06G100900 [Paspalum vaginatum]
MFPCPLLLGPLFFLFHAHTQECLRTIGMGGIWKHQTKLSFHPVCQRRKQAGWAFLHAPTPTALRHSPVSSSWLVLKSYSIHMLLSPRQDLDL